MVHIEHMNFFQSYCVEDVDDFLMGRSLFGLSNRARTSKKMAPLGKLNNMSIFDGHLSIWTELIRKDIEQPQFVSTSYSQVVT